MTNGTTPRINANNVIRIGRNRSRRLRASHRGRLAGRALFLREFDDQNRILAGQTDEHDESDLRENIHVVARQAALRSPSRADTSARPKSPPAATTSFRIAPRAPETRRSPPVRRNTSPCFRPRVEIGQIGPFGDHRTRMLQLFVGDALCQIDGWPELVFVAASPVIAAAE